MRWRITWVLLAKTSSIGFKSYFNRKMSHEMTRGVLQGARGDSNSVARWRELIRCITECLLSKTCTIGFSVISNEKIPGKMNVVSEGVGWSTVL